MVLIRIRRPRANHCLLFLWAMGLPFGCGETPADPIEALPDGSPCDPRDDRCSGACQDVNGWTCGSPGDHSLGAACEPRECVRGAVCQPDIFSSEIPIVRRCFAVCREPADCFSGSCELGSLIRLCVPREEGCAVRPTFTSIYEGLVSTGRCATGGCHQDPNPRGRLNYRAPKSEVLDAWLNAPIASTESSALFAARVVPGKKDESLLYVKISRDDAPGESGRMPPGATLPDCVIDAVGEWITKGAMND